MTGQDENPEGAMTLRPLDQVTIQRMVFETFGRRRFLQDSPIRPDVWFRAIVIADRTALFRITGKGKPPSPLIDVLVTPVTGTGAGTVAEALRRRFVLLGYRPPGHDVVDALVLYHTSPRETGGLKQQDSREERDEALRTVAGWAGVSGKSPLEGLAKAIESPLLTVLPDGRWENPDQLRAALRYALQKAVGKHARELFGQPQNVAQGMREVAASLRFSEIYRQVLPLTAWWRNLPPEYRDQSKFRAVVQATLSEEGKKKNKSLTAAQFVSSQPNPEYYRIIALAAFIMGLGESKDDEEYRSWRDVVKVLAPEMARDLDEDDALFGTEPYGTEGGAPRMDDERVLRLIKRGAEMELPEEKPGKSPAAGEAVAGEDGLIWAIQRNRRAGAPQATARDIPSSHATIKADAARRLFALSTRMITWAVIDTGIDLRHAAFRLRPPADKPKARVSGTRVERVLDFSLLREIMSERVMPEDLPAWPRNARKKIAQARVADARSKILAGIDYVMRRNRLYRDLDWNIVAPLIELPADGANPCWAAPTNDHGTHVAGILAGDWWDAKDESIFVGVCPDLRLIDLRVFGEPRTETAGLDNSSTEYAILAAIEYVGWLNRTCETPVVHGVNMSLAVPHRVDVHACGQTPICRACNGLSATGTVVVAAAGNSGFEIEAGKISRGEGYRDISISDPGNADEVITVGATHAYDPHIYGVSYFSGRGPTGDGRRKPDLVAPGERIRSAILWGPTSRNRVPEPPPGTEGERLDCKDGTSMAAPHVSGAAALLMARHGELIGQPRRIKEILMRTATDLGREPHFQGAGLVDVLRALQSV